MNSQFDLDSLEIISPSELARIIDGSEFGDRVIRACVIAASIDGSIDRLEVSRIERYAEALEVDLAPVRTAWRIANRNLFLARIDIIRKSLAGFKVRQTFEDQGLTATIKQFLPIAGVGLPDVARRYRRLQEYEPGTLGRELTHYLAENRFPYPGEKGAGPEIIVVHDCLHILGGYGTSAAEEIEVAAFQAGCQSNDPLNALLFGLAQYHLDIQVAPVAPSQALQANPEAMLAAFVRGCRVRKDMWADFEPWDHFDRGIDALRVEFGIGPK